MHAETLEFLRYFSIAFCVVNIVWLSVALLEDREFFFSRATCISLFAAAALILL